MDRRYQILSSFCGDGGLIFPTLESKLNTLFCLQHCLAFLYNSGIPVGNLHAHSLLLFKLMKSSILIHQLYEKPNFVMEKGRNFVFLLWMILDCLGSVLRQTEELLHSGVLLSLLSSRDPPIHCAFPSCVTGSKTHKAHSKYSSGMLWKVRRVDLQDTGCICFRGNITENVIGLFTGLHFVSQQLLTLCCLVILTLQTIFHSISKTQWVQTGFSISPLAIKWGKKVPWWGIQSHH